jgi:hypothetical protein
MICHGYKVEGIRMIDHTDLANLHWNNYLVVSSWWQNTHSMLLCQLYFSRLALVPSFTKIPCKYLHFKRNFHLPKNILLSTDTSGWTSALYMESNEIFPLSCRFHQNSSTPCVKWTVGKRYNKAFHDTSLGPTKSLLNITFSGEESITLAIVSLLWWTVWYRARYYSQSVVFPSHLSSQNLIDDSSLIENDPNGRSVSSSSLDRTKMWVPMFPFKDVFSNHVFCKKVINPFTYEGSILDLEVMHS